MKSNTLSAFAGSGSRGALSGLALIVTSILIVFALSACSNDKSNGAGGAKASSEAVVAGDAAALPEGHPATNDISSFARASNRDHSKIKSSKEVKVSDEILAMYKFVNLEITDRSTGDKEVVKLGVGSAKELEDGFTLQVESFLPDYAIFEDYIGSRSNELSNPAVLVRLNKGTELVSSGWVFEGLIKYNSYSNMRYAVVLMPTK